MELLTDILFVISDGLMIPVVLLLLYFFVRSLVALVLFFRGLQMRGDSESRLSKILEQLTSENAQDLLASLDLKDIPQFSKTVAALLLHRNDESFCEMAVANYEVEIQKRLCSSRNLIKFGPILGLMGTLIPMGPALVGLATGDIASMASNMQMAFATTVVGMLISAIGVLVTQVEQRYLARRMNDIEYICRRVCNKF